MNYLIKREREKKNIRFVSFIIFSSETNESRYTNILIYLGYIVEPIFLLYLLQIFLDIDRSRSIKSILEKKSSIFGLGVSFHCFVVVFLSHICTLDERRENEEIKSGLARI